MTRTLLISSFICSALAIGCGDSGKGNESTNATPAGPTSDSASETGGADETTGSTGAVDPTNPTGEPETTTMPATSEPTTAGTADPTGFIVTPDGGGGIKECDVFAQDCEDGEKCTAWAEGGGSAWNATKCVPVSGTKVPGDPCVAEGGGVSGLDDCEKGAMCWDVDAENNGICVQLCTGTEEMPMCADPDQGCAVVNEGVLNICLDTCEPLVQDCPGDDLCLPVGGTYLCVLDASGDLGANFDPCEYANACDKGLICLGPAAATECDQGATGCCMPMCSIEGQGADCPGEGQACLAVYEPQPPGYEDIGYCSLQM
jgi:hypothetical protein